MSNFEPIQITYITRHFKPFGGDFEVRILLEMLEAGIAAGTLLFDGRDFYSVPVALSGDRKLSEKAREDLLMARCFDGIRDQVREELKGIQLSPNPPRTQHTPHRRDISL